MLPLQFQNSLKTVKFSGIKTKIVQKINKTILVNCDIYFRSELKDFIGAINVSNFKQIC